MSKLLKSAQVHVKWACRPLQNRVTILPKGQQGRLFTTSKFFSTEKRNDFRHIGTEKDAGALQDLLRRVMEIDADITNTPVVDFKPNTQQCVGYHVADTLDVQEVSLKLKEITDFRVTQAHSFSNMIHILDHAHGGDIYLFSNGTMTCWGLSLSQREKFLNTIISKKMDEISSASVEYIVDEDELTDVKADMILLHPHIPSIELSKVAFSYGLGRAAKVTSMEASVDNYIHGLFHALNGGSLSNTLELLHIRHRMIKGSQDGFLGTDELHWTRPELQEYVGKISTQFDVRTRIQIINKKIEYAMDATRIIEKVLSSGGVATN